MTLIAHSQNLAAHFEEPQKELDNSYTFDRRRQLALKDAFLHSENQVEFTEEPDHPPLQIVESDRPGFDYQARSTYYAVFFKETTVKMEIEGDTCWLLFSVPEQEKKEHSITTQNNGIALSEVFDKTDISYEVDTSVLTELLTLGERSEVDRFITAVAGSGLAVIFGISLGIDSFIWDNWVEIILLLSQGHKYYN
jgi:hypothetical protein